MIKKLRGRFIRIAMLSVTAVMLALCLCVNLAHYLSVDRRLCRTLDTLQENRGAMPPVPPAGEKNPEEKREFSPEAPFTTRYFVLYYTADGSLVKADFDKIAAVTEADAGTYLAVAQKHGVGKGRTGGYRFSVTDDGEGRYMAIFLDCHEELRSVRMIALISVCAMAACIALVYGLVVLLSRRAIAPILKASERQKQFITDASHELKTPITVIATSLGVLELEVGKQKWIDKARAQTDRLTELVNALVTLARMEEENPPVHRAFAVSDAVAEVAASFAEFAQSKGLSLQIDVTPGLSYIGDEYAVRTLTSILLENAVKYAKVPSEICCTLDGGKKGLRLCVENVCDAPVEEAQLPLWFDRFYRADPARQTGGFGIGLSVARRIAEQHRGTITATAPTPTTVRFTVLLR